MGSEGLSQSKPIVETAMFTITEAWLIEHQSKTSAWTADQLAAIGIEWPPPRGWKHRVIGKPIIDQQKTRFEMAMRSRQARASTALERNMDFSRKELKDYWRADANRASIRR